MAEMDATRRASYGWSLLVAVGWYACLVTAVLVGRSGIPTRPDRDCSVMFSCLTPLEEAGVLLILGAPIAAGVLICTLVATGLLARLVPSPILAGTLSALVSTFLVAVAGLLWRGAQ